MAYIELDYENPDKLAIEEKDIINIGFFEDDVSASRQDSVVNSNYTYTGQVVKPQNQTSTGSVYYTPVYRERLNYRVWLQQVDKNFEELT